ncbi:MAG TPA: FimV/HubP family polar landmark protein, partial [Rhodocyclaceae bacterium]|nr:FimV/HubP family polar landmark protein [Rhodocyclaceae bacterium]
MKSTVTMPGALSQLAETAESEAAMPDLDLTAGPMDATAVINTHALPETLDFDLGGSQPAVAAAPAAEETTPFTSTVTGAVSADGMDFDLGLSAPTAQPAAEAASESLDFDLGLGTDTDGKVASFSPEGTMVIDTSKDASGLSFGSDQPEAAGGMDLDLGTSTPDLAPAKEEVDFDVKLTDSAFLGVDESATADAAPSFNMGEINLDLSATDAGAAGGGAPSGSADPQWEEANTKLDLAKAYEEMGDLEGARELLREVA